MSKEKILGESWNKQIGNQFDEPYMKALNVFLKKEYKNKTIFPEMKNIFRAFRETSYENTKICLIGQDSYPNSHANGIAFASEKGNPKSLSLINSILIDQFGINQNRNNTLDYLINQGVLLLNLRLTVEQSKPNSHADKGWEIFMIYVLHKLVQKGNVCFITLGSSATKLLQTQEGITYNENWIACEHPSYAAREKREWKSNNCFNFANNYLESNNLQKIKW